MCLLLYKVSSVHWQNDLLLTSSWDTCVKVRHAEALMTTLYCRLIMLYCRYGDISQKMVGKKDLHRSSWFVGNLTVVID